MFHPTAAQEAPGFSNEFAVTRSQPPRNDIDTDSIGEVMTFDETASLLRISRPTLFELIRRNDIPCRRVGRCWRFRREDVLSWLSGNDRVSRSRKKHERET